MMGFKKGLATFLVAAMLTATMPTGAVFAQENDATRGEVAQMLLTAADDYHPNVQKTDIIKGYEDGQLHEEKTVTRAEALIMLNRAFGGFPELKGNTLRLAIPKEDFSDIPKWAEAELMPVFDAGIVAGTAPGVFSPDENVTTEQMELFIDRVFTLYSTNPKDSFYSSVNKNGLETMTIRNGMAEAGTIADVDDMVAAQITELIAETVNSSPKPGSAQEKIKILYDTIMDMEARNAAGYDPIKADLAAIDAIDSLKDLETTELLNGTEFALGEFLGFGVGIDALDSSVYSMNFLTVSAPLSQQAYIGENDTQKQAYLKYLKTLLMLCGWDETQAVRDAQAVFDFEAKLSAAALPPAYQYDLDKIYNVYSYEDLCKAFPTVDINTVYEKIGYKPTDTVIVGDVGLMKCVSGLLTEENLDILKLYLKSSIIRYSAERLSQDFCEAKATYMQEAYGISGSVSLETKAASVVSENLYDYVGEAYAEKYFTEQMNEDITGMIHDFIAVYKERIQNLTWMSDATKEKAILKLDNMRINVGAPDYDAIESAMDGAQLKSVADGGSYYDNIIEISRANVQGDARLFGTPVDKEQWITTPQTVNAFYMPSFNSINFPAAFLQGEIYSEDASYEENLGAIGIVIAHEISHAFDSSGAQYDEQGNAVNWWTEEDAAAFDALCQETVKYFDGQESAPGIAMDGMLTLTENIADLGAVVCATSVGEKTEGFDFKKFYESYANLWLSTASREYMQYLSEIDTHSASCVRVDRVLQSTDKFYEVFDIDEEDGMYVPPEERVRIW